MIWVPLLRVFVWNPWLALLPIYVVNCDQLTGIQISLISLIFGGLLVIPLITMKKVRFLGEADRYFTFFSTLPLAVTVGILVPSSDLGELIYYCILIICLLVSVAMLVEKSKIERNEGSDPEKESAYELSELNKKNNGRVLLVPQNIADKLACFCDCVFVGIHTNVTWDTSKWHYYISLFSKYYPYPSCSEYELKEKFGVRYLVVSKRFVQDSYLKRHHMNQSDITQLPVAPPVFENVRYAIYVL
jgi:uncharacterized MAPEG superfamily protein